MDKKTISEVMREMGRKGGRKSAKANAGKHAEWGRKGWETRKANMKLSTGKKDG